ncbi:MAG: hypothetical protein JNM33_15075 [Rubrivivax sp.]|nr:hypothetical protein [Rubrivivax sp.]
MSAKHGDKNFTGSPPHVKAAREVQQAKQAQVTATVNQRRAGSVGTQLNNFVRRVIK